MNSVKVLAAARALIVSYLAACANVTVLIMSAELAAKQVHSEHATQHTTQSANQQYVHE